jgi:quinol monooxygenase YgiN
MYVITVALGVKPAREEAFSREIIRNAKLSLELEPGCHRFDVAVAIENRGSVFLYELYENEAAFHEHLRTQHYRNFDEVTREWITSKVVNRFELKN